MLRKENTFLNSGAALSNGLILYSGIADSIQ